jgi:hypothetical protein
MTIKVATTRLNVNDNYHYEEMPRDYPRLLALKCLSVFMNCSKALYPAGTGAELCPERLRSGSTGTPRCRTS